MNKFYQAILVILLFFAIVEKNFALHIIGGEMTYVCLGEDPNNPGSNLYAITMKVYRDCLGGGADFDSSPGGTQGTVTVYRGASTNPFIQTIILSAPVVTGINPDVDNNPCLIIPENICVQEGVYSFEVSLPIDTMMSYHLVYQRCCRNQTITNIVNPGDAGSTYTVEITPKSQTECNSSPVFNNFPPVVICVNEPMSIDHSAFDADGDQLVYEFCSPLLGGSPGNVAPNPDGAPPFNEVQFVLPNYSALNPLGVNTNVSIDVNTGQITGSPVLQGQYVVGVCVKEYRDGELLSVVQRDFQFNVAYCEPTVVADLGEVNPGEVFEFFSCVDSVIAFTNESTDEQFIQEYIWEFDVPGNNPLSFSDRDVTVTFPGAGFYTGTMIINPGTDCSDTADIEVTIAPPINAEFVSDYDTCVAGPVDFTDITALEGATVYEWHWDFDDGNESDEQNPTHQYEEPGLRNVELIVTDEIGCKDTISHFVNWYPAPPLIIIEPSSYVGCPPAEISFVNLSTPIDESYDIVWDFGDGGTSNEISPTYTFNTPGLFDINIEITSPIGCYKSDVFRDWIYIDSLPVADFDFYPERLSNFAPTVEFTNNSERAVGWDWTFDQFGSTILKDPTFTFPDTGFMEIELIVTHLYGCQDTMVKIIDVEPKITFFMPNAFTPNQDSKNEFFMAGGIFRGIRDYNMKVINRWGGVVFESEDPNYGWNGRKNNVGEMSQNGVYVYFVTFTGPRGKPHEYKGFATLIR
jgi:gliding motility-associated-like protein